MDGVSSQYWETHHVTDCKSGKALVVVTDGEHYGYQWDIPVCTPVPQIPLVHPVDKFLGHCGWTQGMTIGRYIACEMMRQWVRSEGGK